MFGFKKLSGLDIGNTGIKSCELSDLFGKLSLKRFNIEPNLPAAYKSGEILNPSMLAGLIKKTVKGSKKASFGICGSSVIVKKITIPKMDASLIPKQIRWEAEQYIPFNIDDVNIDYAILNQSSSQESMDLLLVAAQKSKLGFYKDVITQAGLQPVVADVSSFALANCFSANYPELKADVVGLIDLGAFFTHFVVVVNGEIVFSRDIPAGGQRYDEELSKNLGIPEKEAEQLKKSTDQIPDLALDTIKSVSKNFAQQILGAQEFFTETSGQLNLNKFFVTGGASLTPGLVDQLATVLKAEVEFLDVLKQINISSSVLKNVEEIDLQYRSAVAIGLALRKAAS